MVAPTSSCSVFFALFFSLFIAPNIFCLQRSPCILLTYDRTSTHALYKSCISSPPSTPFHGHPQIPISTRNSSLHFDIYWGLSWRNCIMILRPTIIFSFSFSFPFFSCMRLSSISPSYTHSYSTHHHASTFYLFPFARYAFIPRALLFH